MSPEELRIQYQDNLGRAGRLCEEVVAQLDALLASNDVSLGVPIESRVKSWSSIEEKLRRKDRNLESIFDLSDLIGIRLILLFRSDQDRVAELISKAFEIVSIEDASERLSEAEFGYQSRHFVVRLLPAWLSMPTLSGMKDFSLEFQIRTLAQHIWAAASHKLQYKQEAAVPPPLRRTINRVSALLEIVDLEFERVLEERRAYVSNSQFPGAENEFLNVDSLAALLNDLLPLGNRVDDEPYADLLADLTQLDVKTPHQLREILTKHKDAAIREDQESVRRYRANPPSHANVDRLMKGVYFAHVGLAREALRAEFGAKMKEIMNTRKRPRPSKQV